MWLEIWSVTTQGSMASVCVKRQGPCCVFEAAGGEGLSLSYTAYQAPEEREPAWDLLSRGVLSFPQKSCKPTVTHPDLGRL